MTRTATRSAGRPDGEGTLEERVAELDAFTRSIFHDLKEPLRAIEAFSRFLLEDYGGQFDEQGQRYLVSLRNASVRMKSLLQDLSVFSHVSRHVGSPTRVDVGRLVKEVVDGLQPAIEAKGALVEVEDGLPDVRGAACRIDQVFTNLIANALKFTGDDRPVVTVGLRGCEGPMATFYVEDNGIGIDRRYHERIFGMFQRLHRQDEYDGTGAGLAIVKRVVEALGGRVWVESEVGSGATFLFTLPLWVEAASSDKLITRSAPRDREGVHCGQA